MPDLKISRAHALGLPAARKVAQRWSDHAQQELGMQCVHEREGAGEVVKFTRSGVSGTLTVTASHFELHAKLGLFLGAFKGRIESEIEKILDQLLTQSAAKPSQKSSAKKPP